MHRWIRTLLATTLTLTFLAAAARLGWVAQPVSAVPQQPFAAVNPPGGSATDAAVQRLQQRLGARPDDPSAAEAYAQLGNLYLQKARETGDPSYYTRADGVLKRSLELDGDNVAAIVGVGGLHLARHSFAEALQWGERAVQLAPASHAAHGVVGDAAIELGRYQEGMAAVQIMVDLRPGLSSYSRVSYVRELVGDQLGAIAAMESALDAGPPGAEGTNWSRVQLGHLYFASGDLKSAERQYQTALRLLPNYAPAVAGLGRVAAARGDLESAAAYYTRALTVLPSAEYAVALGDVHRVAGDAAAAAKQDDLVRVIARLQRANGMDVDLDMALFEVDLAPDNGAIVAAVETARTYYQRRPSIFTAHVLSWSLFRAGSAADALPYAREALRLGTRDPVMLYHGAAIAAAAGQPAEARRYLEDALAPNPHFHVRYAPEARRLLARLQRPGA